MFNCKLSDFEIRQIDALLLVVKTELLTLQMTIARIESWEDSSIKWTIHAETQQKWDDLKLWEIQLMSAKLDIQKTVNLN